MSGPDRNLSMWQYHLRQIDDLPPVVDPRADVHDDASLSAWQSTFRGQLHERLAPWPDEVSLQLEVAEPTPADGDDGFRRHRVHCRVEQHLDLSAWLLVPDDLAAPAPAVLAVHGHGPDPWLYDAGADAVVGPDPGDPEVARALRAQCAPFGAELARAGFVVLAPDLRGFGARSDGWPSGHHLCDLELTQHVARGALPLTGHVHDLGRCLDVLAGLPEVDPSRIGAAGFSLGERSCCTSPPSTSGWRRPSCRAASPTHAPPRACRSTSAAPRSFTACSSTSTT